MMRNLSKLRRLSTATIAKAEETVDPNKLTFFAKSMITFGLLSSSYTSIYLYYTGPSKEAELRRRHMNESYPQVASILNGHFNIHDTIEPFELRVPMSTKLQSALGVMFLVADSNAAEGGSHCKEAIWLADVLKLNPFDNSKTTKLLLKGYIEDNSVQKLKKLQSFAEENVEDKEADNVVESEENNEKGQNRILCVNEFLTYFHNMAIENNLTEEMLLARMSAFIMEQTNQTAIWDREENPLKLDIPNFKFPGYLLTSDPQSYYENKSLLPAGSQPSDIDIQIEILRRELENTKKDEEDIRKSIKRNLAVHRNRENLQQMQTEIATLKEQLSTAVRTRVMISREMERLKASQYTGIRSFVYNWLGF